MQNALVQSGRILSALELALQLQSYFDGLKAVSDCDRTTGSNAASYEGAACCRHYEGMSDLHKWGQGTVRSRQRTREAMTLPRTHLHLQVLRRRATVSR